jgi:hypothetical protein
MRLLIAAALAIALVPQRPSTVDVGGAMYMCPMHPDVRGKAGDTCPRCGMMLVAAAANYIPYAVDVQIAPRALRPGKRGRVQLSVRNPETGGIVRRFTTVHERVFHLFVVGYDLGYFAHIHPALTDNGVLSAELELPRAGVYELIGDFAPADGPPQLFRRAFATADYRAPLATPAAPVPDLADKIDQDVRVRLVPPDTRAGREQLLTFELRDTATDTPIVDLEPYLGAQGHMLVANTDFSVVFHSHPVAAVSSKSGPTVVFQVMFPRPGTYRAWTQFQRHGRVVTTPFTIAITG